MNPNNGGVGGGVGVVGGGEIEQQNVVVGGGVLSLSWRLVAKAIFLPALVVMVLLQCYSWTLQSPTRLFEMNNKNNKIISWKRTPSSWPTTNTTTTNTAGTATACKNDNDDISPLKDDDDESFVSLVKAARYKTGSWLADSWIPPQSWRLYSTVELQEYYNNHNNRSMLWIGDSTGRRTALVLFELLSLTQHQHQHQQQQREKQEKTKFEYLSHDALNGARIVDEGKLNAPPVHDCSLFLQELELTPGQQITPRICRPVPNINHNNNNHTQKSTLMWNAYLTLIYLPWFQREITTNMRTILPILEKFNIVIITMGIWDVIRDMDQPFQNVSLEDRVDHVLSALDTLQQQPAMQKTRIVWRTAGFYDRAMEQKEHIHDSYARTVRLNAAVMKGIEEIADKHWQNARIVSNITYIHWGGAVEPRSFGVDRLHGDIAAHYGLLPRLVAIQMLTNHLMDLDAYHSKQRY